MYKGFGGLWVKTNNVGNGSAAVQRMIKLGLISFAYNPTTNQKESQRMVDGELVTASRVKGATTYSLQLSFNEIDWAHEGFAANQFPTTSTDVKIPTLVDDTVPSSSPYEIADAYITAGNLSDIFVAITSSSASNQPGYMPRATTPASPGAGEVGIDTTNNKLIFNSAQAGASIAYSKFTEYSSVEDIGGPSGATEWGEFEFWGDIYVPKINSGEKIYFPKVTIASEPSYTIDDGVPTVTIDCSLEVPDGWKYPYRKFNMNTATA